MAAGIRAQDVEEFGGFVDLSREIGSDILKTQGAGGNTSWKRDGLMWVKASGTWLAHARERDIMVPVRVEPLVAALRDHDPRAEKAVDFIVNELNASGLRPSIETSFHAALPQTLVAHYHCVNTIALSVLKDRDTVIRERMAQVPDLTWATIPYRRPGTPLAHEIDRVAESRPDVLILYNHGILVAGDTAEQVRERIRLITEALAVPERASDAADVDALRGLAEGSDFHPAEDMGSHKTALTPESLAIATGGSLYPDHVVFLGTEIGILAQGSARRITLRRGARRTGRCRRCCWCRGRGFCWPTNSPPEAVSWHAAWQRWSPVFQKVPRSSISMRIRSMNSPIGRPSNTDRRWTGRRAKGHDHGRRAGRGAGDRYRHVGRARGRPVG